MNDVTTYRYGDRNIEGVTTPAGVALSDEQIGIALGYSDPRKAIGRLVSRNAEELDGLSTSVTLTVVEAWREVRRAVRVWGEQGVMAITFLAKTTTAVEFRRWARETLYDHKHHAPGREPLTEVDKLAGMLTQLMPSIAGRITEVAGKVEQHDERLASVEERQRITDPRAIEVRMRFLETCKNLLVFGTKGKPQAVTFRGYWSTLKDLIGINSFQNRAALTVPMMDKCVEYATEWCKTRNVTPPTLFDAAADQAGRTA